MDQTDLFNFLLGETERRPLTVSELNADVRSVLEREFSSVWVEGEVVGFLRAASGHWYFNLNDGESQIKCVCWKGTNFRIRFKPENGLTIRVRGRLTLYEVKGDFQLVVDSLEPSGEGALAAAYQQIFTRLESEGLFADEIKRPIPFFPRRVGIITSKSGAAFHDIFNVLTRRARSVSIIFAPSLVQGEGSADSVRRALVAMNEYNSGLDLLSRIDVVIVGRGGGSSEDLWAFNDEALARAIRASHIPVISAVGHEIDTTIADHVSDLRAPTPSAAAEIVAAREQDIVQTFAFGEERLIDLIERKLDEVIGATDTASDKLEMTFSQRIRDAREQFLAVAARFTPATLRAQGKRLGHVLAVLDQRQMTAMNASTTALKERLALEMARLDALSPLSVLSRGYSITQNASGTIVRDSETVNTGDKLKIRLEKGTLDAEVLSVE